MRKLCLIFLLITSVDLFSIDMVEIRTKFYSAAMHQEQCDEFLDYLQKIGSDHPIVYAYTGMAHMLMARSVVNPYSKSMHFRKGRQLLDRAIIADRLNPELRFLRLTVQIEAPFFLGYSSEIEEDKKVIRKFFETISDSDLRNRIRAFFILKKLQLR